MSAAHVEEFVSLQAGEVQAQVSTPTWDAMGAEARERLRDTVAFAAEVQAADEDQAKSIRGQAR